MKRKRSVAEPLPLGRFNAVEATRPEDALAAQAPKLAILWIAVTCIAAAAATRLEGKRRAWPPTARAVHRARAAIAVVWLVYGLWQLTSVLPPDAIGQPPLCAMQSAVADAWVYRYRANVDTDMLEGRAVTSVSCLSTLLTRPVRQLFRQPRKARDELFGPPTTRSRAYAVDEYASTALPTWLSLFLSELVVTWLLDEGESALQLLRNVATFVVLFTAAFARRAGSLAVYITMSRLLFKPVEDNARHLRHSAFLPTRISSLVAFVSRAAILIRGVVFFALLSNWFLAFSAKSEKRIATQQSSEEDSHAAEASLMVMAASDLLQSLSITEL